MGRTIERLLKTFSLVTALLLAPSIALADVAGSDLTKTGAKMMIIQVPEPSVLTILGLQLVAVVALFILVRGRAQKTSMSD